MQYTLAASVLTILFIAGIWDIFCLMKQRPEDMVSAAMYTWAALSPAIPFLVGFLTGHLFWPNRHGVGP